eukprot:TRINITY_DN497_c4_g1_i1.p2 TRINITY_DN497_c4_g1~~TRINITY_DN497_c4_g1_i1.p2  ORF type:complete len:267 (+),score=50.05 TRINITY_DN497_c4_g1_i1:117-803(+)
MDLQRRQMEALDQRLQAAVQQSQRSQEEQENSEQKQRMALMNRQKERQNRQMGMLKQQMQMSRQRAEILQKGLSEMKKEMDLCKNYYKLCVDYFENQDKDSFVDLSSPSREAMEQEAAPHQAGSPPLLNAPLLTAPSQSNQLEHQMRLRGAQPPSSTASLSQALCSNPLLEQQPPSQVHGFVPPSNNVTSVLPRAFHHNRGVSHPSPPPFLPCLCRLPLSLYHLAMWR